MTREEKEIKFNQDLVRQYLKYGSVDEVIRRNRYRLPISYAGYQRVLDKWGIVKAAGPNSKLVEAIEFFTHLAKDSVPIEKLHKKMPPTFQTSAQTLYRILGYVKQGLTRRVGCGLVITPYNNPLKILLAHDISVPRIKLGKPYGALSLPMGYSRRRDSKKTSITRILQHEVFVKDTIKGSFPVTIVPKNPVAYMLLDIADIRVAFYHLELPKSLSAANKFSSFKLKDYQFMEVEKIIEKKVMGVSFRAGVVEAVSGYLKYLELVDRNLSINPLQHKSVLNYQLGTVTVEIKG